MKKKLKNILKKIKEDYLFEVIFVFSNLLNDLILRIVTVRNGFSPAPILMELFFLTNISLIGLAFKKESRPKFFITLSVLFNVICNTCLF